MLQPQQMEECFRGLRRCFGRFVRHTARFGSATRLKHYSDVLDRPLSVEVESASQTRRCGQPMNNAVSPDVAMPSAKDAAIRPGLETVLLIDAA